MCDLVVQGDWLLGCSSDNTVRVWGRTTWECLRVVQTGHRGGAVSLAVHDGKLYCGGGYADPTIQVIDTTTRASVEVMEERRRDVSQLLVRKGKLFSCSYDNTIKVWHLDGGACLATLEGHAAWIRSLLVTHDETHLFSGDDDGIIKVWRTDTYALQRELLPDDDGRAGGILAITMDATRNLLLAGSYDSSIYVWSLPHFELLHVLRGHRSAVRSLIVHGDFILSGSYDRSVKLWDLNQECSCAGSLGTRGSVWAMVVLEGLLVGAVGDSSIKVWRMDTWEQTAVLSGHRGLVLALACFGDRLISGSDDRCIRVWRAGSWECERILTGHNGGVVGVCIVHGACCRRALGRPQPLATRCLPYARCSPPAHIPCTCVALQVT